MQGLSPTGVAGISETQGKSTERAFADARNSFVGDKIQGSRMRNNQPGAAAPDTDWVDNAIASGRQMNGLSGTTAPEDRSKMPMVTINGHGFHGPNAGAQAAQYAQQQPSNLARVRQPYLAPQQQQSTQQMLAQRAAIDARQNAWRNAHRV